MKSLEETVARLYAEFAAAFPEDRALWEGLISNEEGHARRVEELKGLVVSDRDAFEPDKFNPAVIKTYIAGLEDGIRRVKNSEIHRHQAVILARDFENSLVEGQFFRVVRIALPSFKQISGEIVRETQTHRPRLIDYLQTHFVV